MSGMSHIANISTNNDILIKEADKGGASAIINIAHYMTGCSTLL